MTERRRGFVLLRLGSFPKRAQSGRFGFVGATSARGRISLGPRLVALRIADEENLRKARKLYGIVLHEGHEVRKIINSFVLFVSFEV